MSHYKRLKRKRLGDILVVEKVATKDAVISALHEQQKSQRLLSDILLDEQELGEWDLARVVVEQYQVPFVDLSRYSLHKDLLERFPPSLLHAAAVVPLDRFGEHVCFACQEIPGEAVVEKLKKSVSGGLHFYVALSLEIRRCLAEHAPLSDEERAKQPAVAAEAAKAPEGSGETEGGEGPVPLNEDSAWKELFDAANEAILQDLNTDE